MSFLKTYRPHHISTLVLGLPIVVGQLGQIALGFADNIMVGHYNTDAYSAAALANQLFNLPILFGLGFSYGLTPIVAQLLGQNEKLNIGNYLRNSIITNAGLGILLALIMLVVYLNIDNMGQPEEILPVLRPYFILQLVSLPFIMLFNAFKQFSDGIMDTRTPMWIMIVSVGANIIGNYMLIYGKWGAPEMGLTGAGISTLASRILMLVMFVVVFYRNKRFVRYRLGFARGSMSSATIKVLGNMGVFVGLQMGIENGAFSLGAIMMGWLGKNELAAHQTVTQVSTLGFMIYYAIGAALAIRLSHYMGRRDWLNANRAAYAGLHIIIVLALLVMFGFALLRYQIPLLFTNDSDVIQIVVALMLPCIIYQLGDGLQVCFSNALRALGDVRAMAIISFVGYFVLALPIAYLLGFVLDFGAVGIWFGYPIGLTLAGIMFYIRYKYKMRQQKLQMLA